MSLHVALRHLDRVLGGRFAGRAFTVTGKGTRPSDLAVRDDGPAPTPAQIKEMIKEAKKFAEEWEAEQSFTITERDRLLVKVLADLQNRLAVLEGKEEISEADYVKHLAALLTEMRGA